MTGSRPTFTMRACLMVRNGLLIHARCPRTRRARVCLLGGRRELLMGFQHVRPSCSNGLALLSEYIVGTTSPSCAEVFYAHVADVAASADLRCDFARAYRESGLRGIVVGGWFWSTRGLHESKKVTRYSDLCRQCKPCVEKYGVLSVLPCPGRAHRHTGSTKTNYSIWI